MAFGNAPGHIGGEDQSYAPATSEMNPHAYGGGGYGAAGGKE